ncbi:MAG: lysophospholipase [Oligoflexales bacterium]
MLETLQVTASDNVPLTTHIWTPQECPKAIVQIVHGMSEHSLRYDHVAKFLLAHGYAVFANDHRGHGKTASLQDKGHYADKDGWNLIIQDLFQVRETIQTRHPNIPVIMIGHSMGSFMTQQYMIRHGRNLRGVVLSGSNYDSPSFMQAARLLPWLESQRIGPRGKSTFLDSISFGSFNKEFKPVRTTCDWLSRDPEEVDKYLSDPQCGFLCTNQLWLDLLGGLSQIFNKENQKLIPKTLPILIMGGSKDPVSKSRGLAKLQQSLQEAGVKSVDCKIFEGARHEIFNESNKSEVLTALLQWLEQIIQVNQKKAS